MTGAEREHILRREKPVKVWGWRGHRCGVGVSFLLTAGLIINDQREREEMCG